MALLDYSSEPQAVRSRELRIDRILPKLYFDYGLQHYVSWSNQPEHRYVLIQSASLIDGGLQLRLCNVEYTIRTHRQNDHTSGRCFVSLKLTADGRPVYEAKYLQIGEYDDHVLLSVVCLEEGEWLQHFRALVGEVRESRNAKGWHIDEPTDDEFYGYSLTLAELSETRCQYSELCPLVGSERILNFADGPAAWWICEYHWAKFLRTIRSVDEEISSAAPSAS